MFSQNWETKFQFPIFDFQFYPTMNTQEQLESRLFCLMHLREYYLHEMLSTSDPLRQDTLLVLLDSYNQETNVIFEASLNPDLEILNQKVLHQYAFYKDN